jgi:hypothetical protein
MHTWKNKWFYLGINIIVILFLYFLNAREYNLKNLINAFFYISFLYVMLTLFLYVMKQSFFDGVVFGFRRFRFIMSKNKDYLEEWKEKPLPSQKVNKTFYDIVKFQAIVLFTIMILLLCLYYL